MPINNFEAKGKRSIKVTSNLKIWIVDIEILNNEQTHFCRLTKNLQHAYPQFGNEHSTDLKFEYNATYKKGHNVFTVAWRSN